ncbi:Pyoverdine/dityrosine biosynthesis protein-domain-containing protein [Aspergillus desertorum]
MSEFPSGNSISTTKIARPLTLSERQSVEILELRVISTSTIPHMRLAEGKTTLFETTLKNTSQDDRWHITGRKYIIDQVYSFFKDSKKIGFCLPALLCKLLNRNKVAGVAPDAAKVGVIYAPGARLWVISDGHVFPDCIGVDDALPDSYGAILVSHYKTTTTTRPSSFFDLQFTGLEDFFFPYSESTSSASADILDGISILQPIETIRTESAQKCRLLLDAVDPETLALYQGHFRFMLEDLGAYLAERNIGSKARKRLASKVAEEMVARNYAYSNLVELPFSHRIRLSIHAHTNCGPKFGIRLFPRGTMRAAPTAQSLLSLTEFESKSESEFGAITNPLYEFKISTTWHACLVRVKGLGPMVLTRSGTIRDVISRGLFEGGWCQGVGGRGGYFAIRRVKQEVAPAGAMEEVYLHSTQAVTRIQTEIKINPMSMEPMYPFAEKNSVHDHQCPYSESTNFLLGSIQAIVSMSR